MNADTHAETTGGGGRDTKSGKDPLKDVPQRYIDHWTKKGYTREAMLAEAQFIKPRQGR